MPEEYRESAVNYWKEISKDVGNHLYEINDVLLLLHNSVEFSEIVHIMNNLPCTRLLIYFSLTKSFESMQEDLPNLKVKMFTVDCVSETLFKKKDSAECIYRSAPVNTQVLLQMVEQLIVSKKPMFLVLDSLSQFFDFSSDIAGSESIHGFVNKLKEFAEKYFCRTVLLYDDNMSKVLKSLPTYVIDSIIRMEKIYTQGPWQG